MKVFNGGQQIAVPGQKLFDMSSATVWYIGESLPGTDTAFASWRIKRITFSGGNPVSIAWANGGAPTATWDDRASETYS